MDTLWQDLRGALRALGKSPGFSLVVILTLAFGIGANTTVFSVINTMFLSPLPVERQTELVTMRTTDATARSNDILSISHPNLKDVAERNQVFDSVAWYSTNPTILTLLEGNTPRRLFGRLVTGNFFETLGLRPAAGRFFRADEDAIPGTSPVLVMSHAAWQMRFGGAQDIVGRSLNLGGTTFTVIGVAPKGFIGLEGVFGPDVWIPTMMAESVLPAQNHDWLRNRGALSFRGVGRLKSGVSAEQAGANLVTIAAALEQEYPDANRGRSLAVTPVSRAAMASQGSMSATTMSLLLLAIPGLILLIACSNVAHLLLARAATRQHEIAVRLALGSGRRRLIRQLLTESGVLAGISGVVGFGLAYAGSRLLWSFRPPEVAANLIELNIDVTVLLFAIGLSLLTSVIFGLVPALQSSRADVIRALKDEGRSVGERRRGFTIGKTLMVAQVALSLVSLVTAGLLLRSLQHAYAIDPGFETSRMGIALVSPGQAGYSRTRSEQFYRDVRTRLSGSPGIVSATWATQMPLFARPSRTVTIEGEEDRDRAGGTIAIVNAIDADYFATTGIALVSGRDFTEADRDGSLSVAIVNETLAARAWPGLDPIGRRIRLDGEETMAEVVGIARTVSYGSLGEPPQPCIYRPLSQAFSDAAVLYIRTDADPAAMLATMQREIRALDSHIEVSDVRTIQTVIGNSLFGATIGVGLLTLFGLIALALASLGLYAAMAHAVRQRQREIGVRIALGAQRGSVLGLVLRQGVTLVGLGIAIGIAAAAGVGMLLSGVLFGVTPIDPISIIGASFTLALVATAACLLPARRASRLDPLIALREG